ncbi:MAG: hypothetical protein PWQ63_1167 [Methanolobus sp.]|jgi:hypothetical protein|nr:hypothetical protein [Methanolobus sp.]MDK2948007.1 hypothetical protein [Methanolobus sp.]
MTEHYYNNNINLSKFAAMLTALAATMVGYYSFMA